MDVRNISSTSTGSSSIDSGCEQESSAGDFKTSETIVEETTEQCEPTVTDSLAEATLVKANFGVSMLSGGAPTGPSTAQGKRFYASTTSSPRLTSSDAFTDQKEFG